MLAFNWMIILCVCVLMVAMKTCQNYLKPDKTWTISNFLFCFNNAWLMLCQAEPGGLNPSTRQRTAWNPGTNSLTEPKKPLCMIINSYSHVHINTHWTWSHMERDLCQICTQNLMPRIMHIQLRDWICRLLLTITQIIPVSDKQMFSWRFHYWTSIQLYTQNRCSMKN